MSNIKDKSDLNLLAASLLIDNDLAAPSVHCSYYASLQFIKYSLKRFLDVSYEHLENECKGLGSHNYYIKSALSQYLKLAGDLKHTTLKRNIKDLKEFRENSDYFDVPIRIEDAEKCLTASERIILEIKNHLKR